MKKTRLFAAALFGAGAMLLTGFDSAATAEDVMEKYAQATKEATDFSAVMDLNLAVGIGMDVEGVNMNMDVALLGDLAMDFIKEPLSAKLDGAFSLTIPGEEMEDAKTQMYMVPGDNGSWDCFAYVNDGDDAEWEYSFIPADEMNQMLELLNTTEADMSQLPGTLSLAADAVDINGISCYELTNTITYADLEPLLTEALVASGQFGDEEQVQSTLALVSMALSDIQLNMVINLNTATYLPVKARIDFDGSNLTALSQMLSMTFAQTDAEGNAIFPDLTLDISNLYIEMTYDYTTPDPITVPAEGLQEKAESDGDDSLLDLVDEIA